MRLKWQNNGALLFLFHGPPLWQWQSRWERRKFRKDEDEDEVFMWLLVFYNEKMRGNSLWWSYCGWCIWVLKETTSVAVLAATGIAVGQEEEMEKHGVDSDREEDCEREIFLFVCFMFLTIMD
jgi:hypothetical protein